MQARFLPKYKPGGLILTPLLDMFTIILIFLIVSFEAEDQNFELDPDLELPVSSARSVFKPAVNVSITGNELKVDDVTVATMTNGRFAPSAYDSGEVTPLVEKLQTYHERLVANSPDLETADERAIVLVQADRQLDYATLYLVLRSASASGFVKYRLAIMKK